MSIGLFSDFKFKSLQKHPRNLTCRYPELPFLKGPVTFSKAHHFDYPCCFSGVYSFYIHMRCPKGPWFDRSGWLSTVGWAKTTYCHCQGLGDAWMTIFGKPWRSMINQGFSIPLIRVQTLENVPIGVEAQWNCRV